MEWRERVVKSCSFFNFGISTVWCREARRSRVLDNFVRLESPISGLVKELWGSDSSENVSFSCLLVDPGSKIAKKIDVLQIRLNFSTHGTAVCTAACSAAT